uniref:Putative capsid protein n=1 Tax=Soybean thrips-associated totivirus 1 TaxID=2800856 RepID=A0A7T8G1Z4_9VIRU|nr:putative capsid protein [Soybean thrips-associated totivirus 1]
MSMQPKPTVNNVSDTENVTNSQDNNNKILNSFFSDTLAQPVGYRPPDLTTFRKYVGAIRTQAIDHGAITTCGGGNVYEIGKRHLTKELALEGANEESYIINATYSCSQLLSQDFTGLARKFSNFSANYDYGNLCGLVHRLAKTLAATSLYKGITSKDMMAGKHLHIIALGVAFNPVAASASTVFIPRLTNSILQPDVFEVLCAAAAGEGATVASDMVEIDLRTNQPIVRQVDSGRLPSAIVEALRILAGNFSACDQGDLYSLAFTKGIHSVATVVGHTDEGGILRDVLRSGFYSTPSGGIYYSLNKHMGLPSLNSSSPRDICGYVDSILLKTAALVAHCDPGQIHNDEWFPTIHTVMSEAAPEREAGGNTEPDDAFVHAQYNNLSMSFSQFAQNYTSGLSKLFLFGTHTPASTSQLVACYRTMSYTHNRHLRFATIAPYYWIEPTSLMPRNIGDFPAELNGYASLAGVGETVSMKYFDEFMAADHSNEMVTSAYVKIKSFRKWGLYLHLSMSDLDGVAHIRLRQLDPKMIILPGAVPNDSVAEAVTSSLGMDSLAWKRGQSVIPAPAEVINLSTLYGVQLRIANIGDDGNVTFNSLPTMKEMANESVSIAASMPVGVHSTAAGVFPSKVHRARTSAATALQQARTRERAFGFTNVEAMPISLSTPCLANIIKNRQPTGGNPLQGDEMERFRQPMIKDTTANPAPSRLSAVSTNVAKPSGNQSSHRAPLINRGGDQRGGGNAPTLPTVALPETLTGSVDTATPNPTTEATAPEQSSTGGGGQL